MKSSNGTASAFLPGPQNDIPIHYYFHILGTESVGHHYGVKTEALADILAARYTLFQS